MDNKVTLIADFSVDEFVKIPSFPHPTQMSIMPVVATKGDQLRFLGTCFAISNHGLVLTARHVLEEAIELGAESNEWQIGAIYVSDPIPEAADVPDLFGGLMLADKVYTSNEFDIGAMRLNLLTHKDTGAYIPMPALELSPGLPNEGEVCLTLGYHNMNNQSASNNPYHKTIEWTYSASKGVIEEIHFPRRDSSKLKFPCFRTSLRHEPGMSGAPVFSEASRVIGIVCSSIKGQDIYYVSLIGLALFLQIDAINSEGNYGKVFLYDFITGGAIGSDKTIDDLNIQREGDLLQVSFGKPPVFTGRISQ